MKSPFSLSQRYLIVVSAFVFLFMVWFLGSYVYGSFILPSPVETVKRLGQMLQTQVVRQALLESGRRALLGFSAALIVGTLLGVFAGLSQAACSALKPLTTICMGIPPIAWIVLALLWFGLGDGAPVFAVFISAFPLLFFNTLAGMRSQDPHLQTMSRVFGLGVWQRMFDIVLPHLAAYIFPGVMVAWASAWKVTIMAELFSASGGLGDQLAASRNTLDTAGTLALVAAMAFILLFFEFCIFEPIKKRTEKWR